MPSNELDLNKIAAASAQSANTEKNENIMNDLDSFEKPELKKPTKASKTKENYGIIDDDDDTTIETDSAVAPIGKAEEAVPAEITMSDIRATMPDLDEKTMREKAPALYAELQNYRKNLIIEEGLSPAEADAAARRRMNKKGAEINNKFLDENPHHGEIRINKENAEDLGLTEEEHEKLTSVKSIRLVLVENKELESIKVLDMPASTDKLKYVQDMHSSLAHYEVPLPTLGDFMGFRGASTTQLARHGIDRENESPMEALTRKANFVYDRLISSAVMPKYDEEGHIILSFDEFCQKFPYFDIDMAIYGIYVASSPESYDGELKCPHCRKDFTYKFVAKDMLNIEAFDDGTREKFNDIATHAADVPYLQGLSENNMAVKRWKSDKTKNIYALQTPSVSHAMAVLRERTPDDNTNEESFVAALMMREMWIWDEDRQGYVHIDTDDVDTTLKILDELNEYDMTLMIRLIGQFTYELQYGHPYNCPHCKKRMNINLPLDELLFLRAQDILAEIQ